MKKNYEKLMQFQIISKIYMVAVNFSLFLETITVLLVL